MAYDHIMLFALFQFKTVVEAGSLNKAGYLLNISQPALSKAMKSLENHFKETLLDRSHSGVTPTATGRMVYEMVLKMEGDYLATLDKIHQAQLDGKNHAGHTDVRLGCSTIWLYHILPEIFAQNQVRNESSIQIIQKSSEELLSDMAEKEDYDLVLCRIINNCPHQNLDFVPLFKAQPLIFAHESHKAFTEGFQLMDLKDSRWLKLQYQPLLNKPGLEPSLPPEVAEALVSVEVAFEVEGLMMAIPFINQGYLIVLPNAMIPILEPYHIKPLPFAKELTSSYWCGMALLKGKEMPLYVRELANMIRLHFNRNNRFL